MKKRILSIICVLALCLTLLPAGALAVDAHVSLSALEYEVERDNTVTITDCAEGARGDLAIPETIDGYKVKKIDTSAFEGCEQITNIAIPNTVTTIMRNAFWGCDGLAEIVIPDSVTYLGDSVCKYCENLQRVVLGEGIKKLSDKNFASCPKLRDVKLPSGLKEIGRYAFNCCDSLTSITLPNNLKYIGSDAFAYSGLTSIVIPDSVEEIRASAFAGCDSLKSVKLGSGMKKIGGNAFMKCTSLENIVIPDSVTNMAGNVFESCTKLKTVTIGGGVKELTGNNFSNCLCLETITFREGVERIKNQASGSANIPNINTLYLPSSLVEIESGCFKKCPNIRDIYYSGTAYSWGGVAIGLGNDPIFSEQVNMHYVPFSDTQVGEYYYDPMVWAIDKGITVGTSNTTFSPYDTCTQGQILTFMYRAAGEPPVSGGSGYTNEKITPGQYYYNALLWADRQGIVTDMDLDPDAPCRRSDVVTYLWRLNGKPAAGSVSFTDVPSGAAYYQAVAWAVAQGITMGTTDTTFSPGDACTRAQIVTFLHRAFAK